MFTHDLMQQEIYESMTLASRQELHIKIGEILGQAANVDRSRGSIERQLSENLGRLRLDKEKDQDQIFKGTSIISPLITVACDQINYVGPDSITMIQSQRHRFAQWNLAAGREAYHQFNSSAALYYFSKGIDFLGDGCWNANNMSLSLSLHEGCCMASFTLGEPHNVKRYAELVMNNALKFEDSLCVLPMLLATSSASLEHRETISKGIDVLNKLGLEIPLQPAAQSLVNPFDAADKIESQLSMPQLVELCDERPNRSAQCAIRIFDAIFPSCYQTNSPFLPLLAAAVVRCSLQHGICRYSGMAFTLVGVFKVRTHTCVCIT